MTTKKLKVPDISNLLVQISEKRESGELPKTQLQHVQPIEELNSNKVKDKKRENSNELKSFNGKSEVKYGRPSVKRLDIEYVKISPRIPKSLKKRVDIVLIEERFTDEVGNSIKTLDEIVALALSKLIELKC